MTAGDIYTVAGTGTGGFSGDGGPASGAELNNPSGVALDGTGNLVIADQDNGRARLIAASTGTFYGKAMTAGDIYTVAGHGFASSGDGRPAATAQFDSLFTIRVDGAGDLVTADQTGEVWLVPGRTGTLFGRAMTAGDAYDVAGTGRTGFSGDGGPAREAKLAIPSGAAWDGAGNLVIADSNNNRIRVVAASTGTFYGQAMTDGNIYTIAGTGAKGFSGDGGPATSAELNFPGALSVDAAGNLVFADTDNTRIRVVAAGTGTFYGQAMTAGDIYTVAGTGTEGFSGDGGPATSAEVALERDDPRRGRQPGDRRYPQQQDPGDRGADREFLRAGDDRRGHLHGGGQRAAGGFTGDGGPATSARLNGPGGVAVDQAGNLVIADTDNKPRPRGGGEHRDVLRAGDDGRGHLHGGGHRRGGASPVTAGPAPARTSTTRRTSR